MRRRSVLTLWLQLLIATVMVPVLALVHGLGLMGLSHIFNLTDEALLEQRLSPKSMLLVAAVATGLFALHAAEIGAMAALFHAGGAAPSTETGLILSASHYTTTGSGPEVLPADWRIVGHAESLLGLLLIGWSTAFLVRKIERLSERQGINRSQARRRRMRTGGGYGGHEREAKSNRAGGR